MDDYKRLEHCSAEFERFVKEEVEDMVELAFEAQRSLPDDVAEIPFIGDTYHPHAPRSEHVELKQKVRRALIARKRFEDEAPKYLQPLPLSVAECQPLFRSSRQQSRNTQSKS